MGRAVYPHVCDLGLPLAELLAQILFVDEGPLYCPDSKAYYPYTQQSPTGWLQVVPSPPSRILQFQPLRTLP